MSIRWYALTLGVLLALTAASFGFSYLSLGALEMPVALGIAGVKVFVVGWVFMGLRTEPPSHRFTGVVAVLFVVLLSTFAALDVITR